MGRVNQGLLLSSGACLSCTSTGQGPRYAGVGSSKLKEERVSKSPFHVDRQVPRSAYGRIQGIEGHNRNDFSSLESAAVPVAA